MRHSSTARTLVGFLKSVLWRRFPSLRRTPEIEGIYNYLPIGGLFVTSGQPNESEFHLIKQAGYEHVINLAPTSVLENSVIDEPEILDRLGIEYTHIPVDFKAPSEADFSNFIAAVERTPGDKLWVHCAANMRVSAFTFRYRCDRLNQDEHVAREDLHKIWEPVGVWREFVER